ncbi:pyridoxamine 5'-phosphate oxidase family protein [soil metagenome]
MYGAHAEVGGLEWSWVEDQLVNAGAYWVVVPGTAHPHPRPVWGIWYQDGFFLSIGSPKIQAEIQADGPVTVHLGSINDVVIIEGRTAGSATDSHLLDAYNAKYGWDYTVAGYGPFTLVEPSKVIAWRSAGWAGRDGFQATGRWTFSSAAD